MPIEILNKIFIDDCKLMPTGGGELHIREANEVGLKKVVLLGIPPTDFIAVKLDHFRRYSDYLSEMKDIHKGCDSLLIFKIQDKLHAIFIELKSKRFSEKKGVEPKFIYSKLFTKYALNIAQVNFGDKIEINFGHILFYLKKSSKGPMRPKPYSIKMNQKDYKRINVLEVYRYGGDTIKIQLPKLIQELK